MLIDGSCLLSGFVRVAEDENITLQVENHLYSYK